MFIRHVRVAVKMRVGAYYTETVRRHDRSPNVATIWTIWIVKAHAPFTCAKYAF